MDRLLIDYLPYIVRELPDYKGITTGEQPEFELAWWWIDEVLKNQFVFTAEEMGLSRWEKQLHIIPKATDTYEIRRLRILAAFGKRTPYTMPWLREWMNTLCGGTGGHTEGTLDYYLKILLDYNVLPNTNDIMTVVLEQLPGIVPENMVIEFAREYTDTGTVYVAAFAAIKQVMEVWPELITDLTMTGESKVSSISSMKERMEVYPDLVSGLEMTARQQTGSAAELGRTMEVYPETVSGISLTAKQNGGGVAAVEQQIEVYPRTTTRLESAANVENRGLTGTQTTIEIYPERMEETDNGK